MSQRIYEKLDLKENEEVYKLEQKYNRAKNTANQYKQQSDILKAGGLDNSNASSLYRKWNNEAKGFMNAIISTDKLTGESFEIADDIANYLAISKSTS